MINKFEGHIGKIYRRDQISGFATFGVVTDEIDVKRNIRGEVECNGFIPAWPEETEVIITGKWNEDETSFNVDYAKPYSNTVELSKKLLKRIIKDLKESDESFKAGPSIIKKILEISGPDILDFIYEKDSLERLKSVKADPDKIEKIYNELMSINESYGIINFISRFGGNIANCDKLVQLYGTSSLRRLKLHPYKVGHKIGLDFYTCDKIAHFQKFDALCKERIQSIIYEAVNAIVKSNGATYTTQSALIKQVNRISRHSSFAEDKIPSPLLAVAIKQMSGIKFEKITHGIRIYPKQLYEAEEIIAKTVLKLNRDTTKGIKEEVIKNLVKEFEEENSIKYSDEQEEAFMILRSPGVKIITGGPGTGKTTLVNGIIGVFESLHPGCSIRLCAPTGRAAQRMGEVTGRESFTIHKLLEFTPYGDDEVHHKGKSDPIDAEFIIVDEMSMVDTELFSILLPAIKKNSTLLLIGDENQLQSVSPGNILFDLIRSNEFETYRLKTVYRQKGDTTIIDNAYKVLDGKQSFVQNEMFSIEEFNNETDANLAAIEEFMNAYDESDISGVQILSPVKLQQLGTIQLNRDIVHNLQSDERLEKGVYRVGKNIYGIGDRVIFHQNNYDKDYYNGDIGIVTEILKNGIIVNVNNDSKTITGHLFQDISHAFAITIHKSQGSEFKYVIIVLPDRYQNMLTKNLLFTAITRAKIKVSIKYVNSALYDSVHTITIDKRNTGLVEKIKKQKSMGRR